MHIKLEDVRVINVDSVLVGLAGCLVELASRPPQIFIDMEEVEDRTGMTTGADLIEINIINHDGRTAKFFVDARITNQGKPALTLATNIGNRSASKKLTGQWR